MLWHWSKLLNAEDLEPLFRHKVLSMLKKKGLIITDRIIELISLWRHSGFNVYCGASRVK